LIKRAKWIGLVFFVIFSLWIASVVIVERYLNDYWIELSSYKKHWLWSSYVAGSAYTSLNLKVGLILNMERTLMSYYD